MTHWTEGRAGTRRFSSACVWYKAHPSRQAAFPGAAMNGGSRKGLGLLRPAAGSTSPSPRLKDAESKAQTGRGGLAISLLSLPSFLLRPLCFLFFCFSSCSSLWPMADCGGRNAPGLLGPSCFLPGMGSFLFPAQLGLDTTHQALGFGSL